MTTIPLYYVTYQSATQAACQPPLVHEHARFSNHPPTRYRSLNHFHASITIDPAPYMRSVAISVESPHYIHTGTNDELEIIAAAEVFTEAQNAMKGAVEKELERLGKMGKECKVVWSHKYDDQGDVLEKARVRVELMNGSGRKIWWEIGSVEIDEEWLEDGMDRGAVRKVEVEEAVEGSREDAMKEVLGLSSMDWDYGVMD
ncbi:hypothetical protein EK21DRAFT_111594 [Setomelanomma holmii]|uniref:Uncharacterized protein n=1 Tax=Setomelanomma holmii TaxID=210430 RepID=A0A9P4HAX8_9PLEO|nr:hypothetical protein EK21DRAFT_111594 [Setomelanomma holmii]